MLGFTYKAKTNTGISDGIYYYVKNLQGDIIGILNSSGTEVASHTYDAWGNHLSQPTSGVGATMEDWISAGSDSIWTKAVKDSVIKWDGVG